MSQFPWSRAIDRICAEKGLTQGGWAEAAKMKAPRISELRRNPYPNTEQLNKLAIAAGVELFEFFVSDDQLRVLREAAKAREAAEHQDRSAAALTRLLQTPVVMRAIEEATAAMAPKPEPIPPSEPLVEVAPPVKGRKRKHA